MSTPAPPVQPDLTGDLVLVIPAGALVAIVTAAVWFWRARRRDANESSSSSRRSGNGDKIP